jgi:hypothetical protein
VVALDLVVVAGVIERSFDMFLSISGTWLPFVLILAAIYAVGVALRRH